MCTVQDQHTILICDVAIGQVREHLTAAFGDTIEYTPVAGRGTLVQAPPEVASEQFQALSREAIARAQSQTVGYSPTAREAAESAE
jgi:hypothetical protein